MGNERTATWYDTLRDAAGYPLAAVPDQVWANATNDVMGDSANTEIGLLFPPGDRRVMERSLDIPHRESMMPASIQVPRPWDVELGTWPWAGDKAVLGQPVTAAPLFFQYPIEDGLPSPSGAARAMIPNTPSLDPNPLTWRVPPSPWDTGGDVGYDSTFIDSGTVRNGR